MFLNLTVFISWFFWPLLGLWGSLNLPLQDSLRRLFPIGYGAQLSLGRTSFKKARSQGMAWKYVMDTATLESRLKTSGSC